MTNIIIICFGLLTIAITILGYMEDCRRDSEISRRLCRKTAELYEAKEEREFKESLWRI